MRPNPSWSDLPVRDELREAKPYGAPQLDVAVRLNVNENPYPPDEATRTDMAHAVASAAATINRYPDREARALRERLARYLGHGLTADEIWAANGSNEVMIQILQGFGGPGRSVLTFTPSYSMYPEYARDTHTTYLTVPRTSDYRIDVDSAHDAITALCPDVTVIATPNNPTGTVTSLDTIEAIAEATHGIVIVDEAYQEFSSHPSALELLPRFGNLIILRTMSKAFAFAGGRLGYAATNTAIVDALRVVRLPYHLSGLTQAVASVALDHADEMLREVDHVIRTREWAMAEVCSLGLDVIASDTNFFLIGPFTDRHAVWQALLDREILVRETGPDAYLRVSVGTDEEMRAFLRALADTTKGKA